MDPEEEQKDNFCLCEEDIELDDEHALQSNLSLPNPDNFVTGEDLAVDLTLDDEKTGPPPLLVEKSQDGHFYRKLHTHAKQSAKDTIFCRTYCIHSIPIVHVYLAFLRPTSSASRHWHVLAPNLLIPLGLCLHEELRLEFCRLKKDVHVVTLEEPIHNNTHALTLEGLQTWLSQWSIPRRQAYSVYLQWICESIVPCLTYEKIHQTVRSAMQDWEQNQRATSPIYSSQQPSRM